MNNNNNNNKNTNKGTLAAGLRHCRQQCAIPGFCTSAEAHESVSGFHEKSIRPGKVADRSLMGIAAGDSKTL